MLSFAQHEGKGGERRGGNTSGGGGGLAQSSRREAKLVVREVWCVNEWREKKSLGTVSLTSRDFLRF
jgi:hypothetical protein